MLSQAVACPTCPSLSHGTWDTSNGAEYSPVTRLSQRLRANVMGQEPVENTKPQVNGTLGNSKNSPVTSCPRPPGTALTSTNTLVPKHPENGFVATPTVFGLSQTPLYEGRVLWDTAAHALARRGAGARDANNRHRRKEFEMTTVIGIDPSLTGTGIALGNRLETIGSAPAGPNLEARHERLQTIRWKINRIIEATPTGDVTLAVIEAPAFSRNNSGTWDRAGLWWGIVGGLLNRSGHVLDVPPTTLKKFATGKGNATKPDMRMALFQRAGIDCRDDNQVDAWWLAELGRHLLDEPTVMLPKTHTDALAKLPPIDTAAAVAPVDAPNVRGTGCARGVA